MKSPFPLDNTVSPDKLNAETDEIEALYNSGNGLAYSSW